MPSPVHHVFCAALVAEAAERTAEEMRQSWREFEKLNLQPRLALESLSSCGFAASWRKHRDSFAPPRIG